MTLESFALVVFVYVPAICFWVAAIAILAEEVAIRIRNYRINRKHIQRRPRQ